jgi:phosphatidylglycerophosphate synthase
MDDWLDCRQDDGERLKFYCRERLVGFRYRQSRRMAIEQNPSGTPYRPVSRRPIADTFRKTAHGAVRLCVKLRIHPDLISYLSIVASAFAAVCFWKAAAAPWLLILGPAFCYLRLWFNMLDGMVALASGKASWRGEILNDLPDRVSDILIFVGVAHSGLCQIVSGYWGALFAVLTAYVGMFGQAVGVQREFSGIMAKPWRMVALHIGSWIALCLGWSHAKNEWTFSSPEGWTVASFSLERHPVLASPKWLCLTVLDWTCLVVVIGCVQTIVVRLSKIFHALRKKGGRK